MDTTPLAPRATIPEIVTTAKPENKSRFSFGDFLDVINPLQHIPVVSTIYRKITGDDIGATARLAGGTLFGGALGLAAAGASALIDKSTGKDIGEHILAAFTPDSKADETIADVRKDPARIQKNDMVPPQVTLQGATLSNATQIPTLSPQALQNILTATEKKNDVRGQAIPNDQLLAAIQKANTGYNAAQAQKMGWSMPQHVRSDSQH